MKGRVRNKILDGPNDQALSELYKVDGFYHDQTLICFKKGLNGAN